MGGSFHFYAVQLRALFLGQRGSEAHPKLPCYGIFRMLSRQKRWPGVTARHCNDVQMCDKRLKMYADIGVCLHRLVKNCKT
jgi:hypothetical protein